MKDTMKIAVIGASVRFPYAEELRDLDRIYSNKMDCIHDITPKRIRLNGLDENTAYTQFGYLENLDEFDYGFFNISRTEAICIDPQQRICLELACKAIESAGYCLSSMAGTNTAVFVGGGKSTYDKLYDDDTGFAATGEMADAMAGRISYMLDLHGEAMVCSTACSSSMYATYDACTKLLAGSCDAALVGGVLLYFDVMKQSDVTEDAGTIGLAAPDGRCKTFDDRADGINLCEGAGFVFLKRYEDAKADGDNILAVITAAGSNQDGGRSNSFTAPSITAQTEIFTRVWERWGIDPMTIGYYEAHGTGTKIGDPIEIASITEAYKGYTDKKQFCPIGSLKTNYAHPGSAAGVASVLKGILSIQGKKKYPLRDLQKPNHMIDFENSPVYPIAELEEWPDEHRVYAINGFGSTGTNVHIVMENDRQPENPSDAAQMDEYLISISTRKGQLLKEYKEKLLQDLKDPALADCRLGDICATFNLGRDDYEYRSATRISSRQDLMEFLKKDNEPKRAASQKLVLLCSGDGTYTSETIETLCRRYPAVKDYCRQMADYCKDLKVRDAVVDAAILLQLRAWGISSRIMIGTGRGTVSIQLAEGKLAPQDLAHAVEAQAAKPLDEKKFTDYMTMLAEAEDDPLLCLDIAEHGRLIQALRPASSVCNENSGEDRWMLVEALCGDSLLDGLAALYEAGVDLDWKEFYKNVRYRKVFLATYPFEKTSAWPEHVKKQDGSAAAETAEEEVDASMDLRTFLRETWRKTLGLSELGDEDDVFELGANSLVSMSIIKKIREHTGIELDFEDVFIYPTVNELYDYLLTLADPETLEALENGGAEDNNAAGGKKKPEGTLQEENGLVSGNQERMLYILEDAGNKAIYNMPVLYRIEGELRTEALTEAVQQIIQRHEVLHTIYEKAEGEYRQKVLQDYEFDVPVMDGSAMTEAEIRELAAKEAAKPFDLFQEIPERMLLIRRSETEHYWFVNIHHIAADGWSLGVFYTELEQLYHGLVNGEHPQLTPLTFQYSGYAQREHAYLQSREADEDAAYWTKQLEGVRGILDFPTDKQRPEIQQFRGGSTRLDLGQELTEKLEHYCREHNMSEFMLLESVYAILLHLYSGSDDICVGVPFANRRDEDVQQMIGFFANTIVIRSRFAEKQGTEAFLQASRKIISDAFLHSAIPFEEVVKNLRFERSTAHAPLFQYAFTMQNFALSDMALDGVSVQMEEPLVSGVKFDLTFSLFRTDTEIAGNIEYDADLFTLEYVERILEDYVRILEAVIGENTPEIEAIDLSAQNVIEASENPFDSLF